MGKIVKNKKTERIWCNFLQAHLPFVLLRRTFLSCIAGRFFTTWATKEAHTYLSVQFSHSVMSNSLWPHGLQHARPPCPLPTPRVYSKSLSRWCRPTFSSSVIPFSSCLQSFPASGSFQMSQLFTSGSQSIGVSASASVLSMNIQDWSPLGLSGLISLQSKSVLQHHSSKASIFWCSAFFTVQLSHPCMTTGKTIALTSWTFVGKVMSLLFNMLSRLVRSLIYQVNFCPKKDY